jgi:hypothetical protein
VALTADLADDRLEATTSGRMADLVVRGTVETFGLRYELLPQWPGAPAAVRETVLFAGLDRAGLASVLRDRLHRLARTEREDRNDASIAVPSVSSAAAGAGVAAIVLALPFLIGLVWKPRARVAPALSDPPDPAASQTPPPPRSAVFPAAALARTVVWLAAFGGIALVVAAVAPSIAVVYGIGGLAWGAFAVVTVPIIFPPMIGLGRVDADELVRVLAVWLGLVVRRLVAAAALYVPAGIVAWLVADLLAIDEPVRLALVLPIAGLVTRHSVRAMVAVAAARLDAELIDDTDAAAWDASVRAYVIGYLRRAGLPVDDELLRRVRFVPGRGDVAFYGGGLTHTRIVVPRPMLELALSPWGRPHDYAAPRISTLHWTQWNAGLVMPAEAGAVIATREQRLPRDMPHDDASEREPIGELPTLVGIIEPAALDPRKSYRPSEDPLWLDYDSGEEHDGTDAGDRDFLFGIVVHALGAIQRHAVEPHTLAVVARRVRWLDRIGRRLGSDDAGDVHAAIAGARHHLIQYLAWRADGRADLLTARAYLPELETASRRALARDVVGPSPAVAEPGAQAAVSLAMPVRIDAVLGARLARLAGFVRGARARPARWRRIAIAGAVVACAGAVALAAANAVRYHSTYVDRMEKRDQHG